MGRIPGLVSALPRSCWPLPQMTVFLSKPKPILLGLAAVSGQHDRQVYPSSQAGHPSTPGSCMKDQGYPRQFHQVSRATVPRPQPAGEKEKKDNWWSISGVRV